MVTENLKLHLIGNGSFHFYISTTLQYALIWQNTEKEKNGNFISVGAGLSLLLNDLSRRKKDF